MSAHRPISYEERTNSHLAKGVVGFPTALAASVGIVMASPVILTATTGFSIGGGVFVIAMCIAIFLMYMQTMTFAEAAAMLPTTASVYDYIHCGLGRVCAVAGTIAAYLMVHAFAGTAETILSGIMATVNFDGLQALLVKHNATWSVGVGLVVLFAALNYFGLSVFAKVEIALTAAMWLTLMIFGITGLIEAPTVPIEGLFGASAVGSDPFTVMSLVGMAMFMFLGVELVTPIAPELRNSHSNIPKAMMLGMTLVWLCMVIWGAAMQRQVANIAMDPQGAVHLLETPDAIPAFAKAVMGPRGKLWLGIAFLLAGAACINGLMAAVPRIICGMAQDGSLPKVFAYQHPRYKSPAVAILAAAIIPIAHTVWIKGDLDRILPLVLAAVCSWGVAYLLVTLSVVLLRLRRPDLPRAFKAPWFPVPQLLSSVGIFIAIWYITPPNLKATDVYVPFGVILGATVVYALVWTLLIKRQPGFTPARVEDVMEREFVRHGN
jgi:amino acid transporter